VEHHLRLKVKDPLGPKDKHGKKERWRAAVLSGFQRLLFFYGCRVLNPGEDGEKQILYR
jgi:hypothetical protein